MTVRWIVIYSFQFHSSKTPFPFPFNSARMDFARCTDESKESDHSPSKCCSKDEAQPEIVELRAPIEPSTPDADRESSDFPSDSKSPLTQVVTSRALVLSSSDPLEPPLCSPRTPKDGVFDPFSPGPAHLALAPVCRKCFSGSVGFVARRLQFDSSSSASSSSSLQFVESEEEQTITDSELLEAVYENLLELIISHQAESSLAMFTSSHTDSLDCNTPPASFITGIAQTCPDAPVKPSRKSRNLDLGLCRKLEF
ncbi:hypothetical protein SDJN03_04120, partial [Cucurbita argyrosperma subsp. sororia]